MTQSETAIREGDLCVMNSTRADNELVLVLKQPGDSYIRNDTIWIRVLRPHGVIDWASQSWLRPVQREG